MAEAVADRPDPWSLVRFPAALTLAVTLVRLAGELEHWPKTFFNPAPGGGLALVGISWLVPIFGVYFGWKLGRAGQGPERVGAGIGLALLAFALVPVAAFAATHLGLRGHPLRLLLVLGATSIVGAFVAMRSWPALGRTLLGYALAARVPVAVLMLFAMLGNWGTHYDVAGPGFPAMGPFRKWLWLGLLPQMTTWIWFTLSIGALFGIIAGAAARRGRGGKA